MEQYKGRLEFVEEGRGKNGRDIRDMLERILETKYVRTDTIFPSIPGLTIPGAKDWWSRS